LPEAEPHEAGTDTDLANPLKRSADELQPTSAIQAIQPIGKPCEITAVCLFLVDDEASYVRGAESAVDGVPGIGRCRGAVPGKSEGTIGII
jgi:3alpha(or 20beta)-hydroxysteroid dehydrogenase